MPSRRIRVAGSALAAVAAVVLLAACGGQRASDPADDAPPCAEPDPAQQGRLMRKYSAAGSYPARQANGADGVPASVSVEVPPIAFTGAGSSSTLPIGPCQVIYRYRYPTIRVDGGGRPAPFRYVEVDWNTEGVGRGPGDSFVSPHFDFHYYMRSRREVDATTECALGKNGKTCDSLKTGYAQMRRFVDLPEAALVPPLYRPDIDSSIPRMGMHLLDMTQTYTVGKVNHYPVLIYGTFDGELLFAEASVTLYTLQDVAAAKGHTKSYVFRQPPAGSAPRIWPTRFVLRQDPATGSFSAAFERFRKRLP